MVYYGMEYEEKKERQKKTKEKVEAFAMAMKNFLKQPEKDAQRDPGEKGWACLLLLWKGGAPQAGLPTGI